MFGDTVLATRTTDAILTHGVVVTAFSYPVVPKGAAPLRVQLSAVHSDKDIEACVRVFVAARSEIDAGDAAAAKMGATDAGGHVGGA